MQLNGPSQRVSPAATEPLARGFISFIGGPTGRFGLVGRQRWWTPLRVLIAVAWVFLSFGFLSKARCLGGLRGEDGVISLNWAGNRQYVAACYNDIVPLFSGRGLDQGGFPYAYSWQEGELTRYMEYPVLTGLFQGAMGGLARVSYPLVQWFPLPIPAASWYFALTALVMSCMWVTVIMVVTRLAGNRIWDVVLIAASPLVIVHAFTNWDIPSILAMVAAVYFATQARFGLAGVLIGVGTALKLWPLFILGAYLILAIRDRRFGPFGIMTGSAAVTWLVVNAPIMVLYPQAWGEFYRLNSERPREWTTIYAIADRMLNLPFVGAGSDPSVLNTFTLLAFAGCCLMIFIFGLRVSRRPRVAELILLILMAFLLFNKVWSPQYSLWLLVPAVLALPRWRLLLSWMLIDALVWPILMWHMLGAENNGLPGEALNVILLVRLGILLYIVYLVLRQMLGHSNDPVLSAHAGRDPLDLPAQIPSASAKVSLSA